MKVQASNDYGSTNSSDVEVYTLPEGMGIFAYNMYYMAHIHYNLHLALHSVVRGSDILIKFSMYRANSRNDMFCVSS